MKKLTPFTTRTKLIDSLPLETPLGVHISPSTFCNFKCAYCNLGSERGGVPILLRHLCRMNFLRKLSIRFQSSLNGLNFLILHG